MIDLGALGRWLSDAGLPAAGLELEGRARSGSSNVTWFVRAGDEHWVVRHPPTGGALPSANDVAREHRFLSALHGTAVPVAEPLALCEDATVIGVPFLVMRHVDGLPLHVRVPLPLRDDHDARRRLAHDVIDVLAALHEVDWRSRGLTTSTTPYLERQVRRWRSQLAQTPTAARLTGMDEVTQWIEAHVPETTSPCVVHGDYGMHNILVDARQPHRVAALVDWELAAIGDPIADLVNFVKAWGTTPLTAAPNPANDVLSSLGAPSSEELVARYEDRTGRDVANLGWHQAFVLWKSVGVLEGLHARHVAGTGVDEDGARFGALAAAQLERCRGLLEGQR